MRPRISWVLCLALACVSGGASPQTTFLAIRDVTLWDGTGAPPSPHRTVIVRGDRIVEIGPYGEVAIPAGSTLVDGTGRFLMPGLVDMHVHALWDPSVPSAFLPLFVANGVTTVRDMGGILDLLPVTRAALADGSLLGPRVIAPGAILDGPEPVHPEVSIAVGTPEEAVAAVDSVAAAGADFVKVYTLLPAAAFDAVMAAAGRRGLPVSGHAPAEVGAVAAAAAGMRTIDHLMSELGGFCELDRSEECDAVLAAFREHGTFQVPTLVLQGQSEAADLCGDPRLRGLPRAVLEYWFDGAGGPADCDSATSTGDLFRPELPPEAWIIPRLHAAGIPILAGTDAGVPWSLPGWSLHDELGLLVEAGLPVTDALLAATRDAARALDLDDEIGTIRPARVADLLLLRADPLADIGNTRRIEAVVLRGQLLRRAELDSILGR
ncbi:MAG TPA: amidohydrolase family protein [Gemmatimonadota bacterium]|nr:amidohydrolase family protein [Gemmatimonadota bacterium]